LYILFPMLLFTEKVAISFIYLPTPFSYIVSLTHTHRLCVNLEIP